ATDSEEQIELRLMAHYSKDKELVKAYLENMDIHTATAAKVFGVTEIEVTGEMRRRAKAVNFGIIYGISDYGLSDNIGTSVAEAKRFIEKYFETYPSVKKYMEDTKRYAHENGYVRTLFGRVRYIPELKSSNFNLRSFGERAAMNMPLQGSASDIIKIAMINVYNALKNEGLHSKLLLQVHDELIIDAPIAEVDRVKRMLKNEMEKVAKLTVPLVADVSSGNNWMEAK
ncbi:MAG: DNA polymerase I, partial [Clostridia bacterium]|nr:DNA polymerase I [Clostridia bacterium]